MKLSTNGRALSALTLCAALIFSLGGFAPAANAQRRGGGRGLVARAQSMTGDSFGFTVVTPRGARVYAVSRPRAELLRAVDDGLTELFAVARRHGYQVALN